MFLTSTLKDEKKTFKLLLILSLLINLIFFLIIYDVPWFGDDYYLVFFSKLFNLINNYNFTIDDGSIVAGEANARFVPLYSFIYQVLPANFEIFHFIVVALNFISSLIFFKISKNLTKNIKISFLASLLFSIHYSITIKALTWIAFCGHIFNCFFGLLSIYFFLIYLDKNKLIYLILFIFLSTIGMSIMETGLVYPILLFSIVYLFKSKKIYKLSLSVIPILVYFLISFIFLDNSAFDFVKKRTSEGISEKTYTLIEKNKHKGINDELYWYRSTYAPRDFKGYSLRLIDNFFNSINVASLEKSIIVLDQNKTIKKYIKEKVEIFISLFFTLITIYLFYLFKILKKTLNKKLYIDFFIIYLGMLFLYSIVFHRKDLAIALSFPSVLLISILYFDLIKYKCKKLATLTILIFVLPSLIYSVTMFEYIANLGSLKNFKSNFLIYNSQISKNIQKIEKEIVLKEGFKYFYFYQNYDREKKYLKKYKGLTFVEFRNTFER